MTVKEAVDIAIKSGMETFIIHCDDYDGIYHKQTIDTVYDFISGYENEKVLTLYLGSAYSHEICKKGDYITVYDEPKLCDIIYKG